MRDLAQLLLGQIAGLSEKIARLDGELRRRAGADETVRRLTTILGIGPISAAAIITFAPPETFSKGRDFAADRFAMLPIRLTMAGHEHEYLDTIRDDFEAFGSLSQLERCSRF